MKNVLSSLLVLAVGFGAMGAAQAQIGITEVDPASSSNNSSGFPNSSYAFDWFELTNFGTSAVDITGWKIDDNSNSFANAVLLSGITSIAAGQSVVFGEVGSPTNFASNWFTAAHPAPANFLFGTYSGSGVGLSQSGDAVNIYNASGGLVTSITFSTAPSNGSFDNHAGAAGLVSTASVAGVNGAYAGIDGRIGSPGSVSAVPLPAGIWLLGSGLGLLGGAVRRRRAAVAA